jgi:acid phosphatase family membrane protein YuiD
MASGLAWLVAQTLKIIISYFQEGHINFSRLVQTGGMPSSHTAFVMSLSTGVGMVEGWDCTLFAISLVFALVIMYDAAGVRRAAGKQARVLNRIVDEIAQKREFPEERLKELLGHTPVEVFAGAFLGILVAFLMIGDTC